jgi:phosphatidylethanolamine/phosphatidyl-N-methylethanolamine N-methyltransferase
MSLQTSYRFIAPLYDVFLKGATAVSRQRSLSRLPLGGSARVLISGAGTGLDFPFLPSGLQFTALDLTAAMQELSRSKAKNLNMEWVRGDSMSLPFADESFDFVVLHLIVAVVPHPEKCLAEASRVLKPGGRILVFDKFLQRGQRAWLRRSLSFITSQFATRLNVVFEDVLATTPELNVVLNEKAMAGGWFRLIELGKTSKNE